MRHLGRMFSSSVVLAAVLAIAAHAAPPAGTDQLEQLDWIIGNWVWEWNTDREVPGIAQSGEQIAGEMRCEWDLNRHAIDMRLSLTKAGQTVWAAHTLIGWDPVKKCVISRSFDSNGGHGSGTVVQQNDSWLFKTSGVNAQGNELVNAMLFSDIQPEGFSLQGTNRPEDGDQVSFGPKTRFQRK